MCVCVALYVCAYSFYSRKLLHFNVNGYLDQPHFREKTFLGWEVKGYTANYTYQESFFSYIEIHQKFSAEVF